MRDFTRLFFPKSIAVIGSSRDPISVGGTLLSNIVKNGFEGNIFPVNPKTDQIGQLRCYHNVTDITDEIDLAIIIIPAVYVPEVLSQCGQKKIPNAIIISSGFGELGNDGKTKEAQLVSIANEYGISLIGPNCLGILNPKHKLNASFSGNNPCVGPIAFISQSGAICASMIDYANELHIGFSKFVSIGNKADINEYDIIDYLVDDPDTQVICMYAESLSNSVRLCELSKKLSSLPDPKPLILLKAGVSEEGSRAAKSHTGSVSGNAKAYQALFEQANITSVDTVEDLLTTAACFAYNGVPSGSNVAILTNAGGPGILATDSAVLSGLSIASYEQKTKEELSLIVAPVGHWGNPMDVLGDAPADRYQRSLTALVADPGVDSIVTILTPQSTTQVIETAQSISSIKNTTNKPITASFMGDATVQDGISFLQEHSVPTFRYPEDAVRSIGKLSLYAKNRLLVDNPLPEISIQPLPENISRKIDSREPFSLTDAQDLVHSYGFTTPKSCVLPAQPTADDIQKCQSIGNSLAVKIVSKDISHKTDVGGVQLSVAPADLSQSIQTMTSTVLLHKPDALIEGFLISEMIDTFKSIELLVGFRREEGLGTVIVCGSGGIFVELYADVAMRFDPASQTQWEQALSKLKIWKIIEGYRGKDGYPKDSIFAAIARITEISRRHPFISELDINPLLLYPNNMKKDPIALDARISFNTP